MEVWADYTGSLVVRGGGGDSSMACRGFTGERGCSGEACSDLQRNGAGDEQIIVNSWNMNTGTVFPFKETQGTLEFVMVI